jgi:RimJ/RimL family protein N-acetyltransferase
MMNAPLTLDEDTGLDQATEASSARIGFSRRLWLADAPRICAHFTRLSRADRYQRFAHHIDDAGIEAFCRALDWWRTHLVGHFVEGELRGVGELRIDGLPFRPSAELAISVEPRFQNQGIGTEVFQRLIVLARNRGVGTVHMQCLMDNIRLRRIAARFGAQIEVDHGEVAGRLELRRPSLTSWLDEATADSLSGLGLILQIRPMGPPGASWE